MSTQARSSASEAERKVRHQAQAQAQAQAQVLPRPLLADPRPLLAAKLLLALREEKQLPGVACVVMAGGVRVWEGAQGWADVENGVPFTAETAIRVASISKPMTALALLRLHLRGALDLDAPVARYVPQFPHAVTARQLATHTSGLRHFKDNAEKKLARRFPNTLEGIRWFMHDPLEHVPGTRFAYSSFGYAVLGAVVEAATAEPFAEHMRRTVFAPWGLQGTRPEVHEEIIPNRARYYSTGNPTAAENPSLFTFG